MPVVASWGPIVLDANRLRTQLRLVPLDRTAFVGDFVDGARRYGQHVTLARQRNPLPIVAAIGRDGPVELQLIQQHVHGVMAGVAQTYKVGSGGAATGDFGEYVMPHIAHRSRPVGPGRDTFRRFTNSRDERARDHDFPVGTVTSP